MNLSAAAEPLQCPHPDCTFSEGGRCARAAEFTDPRAECTSLVRLDEAPRHLKPVLPTHAERLATPIEDAAPWRGRHFNLRETEQLLQRSPARLIAVLGPYNAGKTCLLASFFLQIASGQHHDFPYRFASSRTLHGFRDLVERARRWTGKVDENILQHTPKEEGKLPGQFLHLGLRPRNIEDDRHIDVLLTDIAGEWIREWTTRADEESRRRLAFIPRSDGFVIVADAQELLGQKGARLDRDMSLVIMRLIEERRKDARTRSLALVLSKFDQVIDQVKPPLPAERMKREAWGVLGRRMVRIWPALERAREAGLDVGVFPVTAFPKPLLQGQPVGVLEPFVHVFSQADGRKRWPRRTNPVPPDARGFVTMRRFAEEEA